MSESLVSPAAIDVSELIVDPLLTGTFAPNEAVNPVQVSRTTGNITAAVVAVWTDLDPGGTVAARPLDVVLPNMQEGDGFDFMPMMSLASAVGGFLGNLAVIKAGAVHRRLFDTTYGYLPWSAATGQAKDIYTRSPKMVVQATDLENGSLRLRFQYIQVTAVRTVNAVSIIPLWLEGRGPFR